MNIILSTNNIHKLDEFSKGLDREILTPKDLNIVDFNPQESADSFESNAMIKAKALYAELQRKGISSKYIILADDSGLCVDALAGKPGILSARWANVAKGEQSLYNSSDEENRIALANSLKHVGLHANTGYFACSIAFILMLNSRIYEEIKQYYKILESHYINNNYLVYGVVNGITKGIISTKETGKNGFGYDSMFYIDTCKDTNNIDINTLHMSIATLSIDKKMQISHRGKAMEKLKTLINKLPPSN